MNILYISWDGEKTSYLESLFSPILSEVSKIDGQKKIYIFQIKYSSIDIYPKLTHAIYNNIEIIILSIPKKLGKLGIVLSIGRAIFDILKLISEKHIKIVIPRSINPGLITLICQKLNKNFDIVFDTDGPNIDPNVELTDLNPLSFTYRFFRDIEYQLLRKSKAVLARSSDGMNIMRYREGPSSDANKYFFTKNGRNTEFFNTHSWSLRDKRKEEIGIPNNAPILLYLGSVGAHYLIKETLEFFQICKNINQKTHLIMIVNDLSATQVIINELKDQSNIITLSVSYEKVADILNIADLGIAFRRQSFTTKMVCPIKIGEYLLCGLPVIGSPNIGDSSQVITESNGQLIYDHTPNELHDAAKWFFETVIPNRYEYMKQCVKIGQKYYSLNAVASIYLRAIDYRL